MAKKKFDFSGFATKVDIKCSDGRIIRKDAFKHNDGQTVPLVWQHLHNDPSNILGHAILENRKDGVYAYCTFNDTDSGKNAKSLVEHGDIKALSIHANQLQQKGNDVLHGEIREVSLVLAGANPGALIDNLSIQHGDAWETDDTEAIIYSGEEISLKEIEHLDSEDGETVQEVLDSMTETQRNVVYALISHAAQNGSEDDSASHSGEDDDDTKINHSEKGGKMMKKNVFDNKDDGKNKGTTTLTHDQFATILETAKKNGGSLKDAILSHAVEYGIEDIDVLFPDAQTLSRDPEWLKREDSWVQGVLSATHKSPFSRIKSVIADMDIDTARAKGYIKATEKKEVYFKASKRTTNPCTVYVKQKLDRDDIIDVTDFDIVAMVRMQLRTLLDEELAVAVLVGDGRALDDQYKIDEECIRPIWKDDALYTVREELSTKTDYAAMIEEIALSGNNYKGSGSPVFYTTNYHHMKMLWVKDKNDRRIYESDATLCAALGVSRIQEVSALENKVTTLPNDNDTRELIGIKVNLRDYNMGADKGGQVASFDDFDIDFNQYKYLMETRCSGCLTKPKSAQVYEFKTVVAG